MSELRTGTRPARLMMGASPRSPGAPKPETELGAASTIAVPHPDSRWGPSPHLQGRVMDEQCAVFVGIDVSKDRLDVYLRPSGEAFCVPREGSGLDDLVMRLERVAVILVLREALRRPSSFRAFYDQLTARFSEERFELGEDLLDRVQVGAVGRQEEGRPRPPLRPRGRRPLCGRAGCPSRPRRPCATRERAPARRRCGPQGRPWRRRSRRAR